MNKKTFFVSLSVFHLILVSITIFNIIFCYITSQSILLLGSLPYLYIPYFRFIHFHNIVDLFILILFTTATLFLSINTLIEMVKSKVSTPFLSINLLWVWFTSYSCCFTDEILCEYAFSYFTLLINLILLLILFVYKSFEHKASKNNLERHIVSYKKIEKTSKQIYVIEASSFIFCMIFQYFSNSSKTGKELFVFTSNVIYIFVILIAIVYFIATNDALYRHRKTHLESLPNPNFVKQINIKQIVSFSLFLVSYILIAKTGDG